MRCASNAHPNRGSNTRERVKRDGQGVSDVGLFMDEVMADLRRRLALLGDSGDRRAIEDGIALLGGCRAGGMDGPHFESLLSMLRAGRAPAGRAVLKPQVIACELTRRWHEYTTGAAVTAQG